jgi:RNA polymerase sigma factor (sigma-70 family)
MENRTNYVLTTQDYLLELTIVVLVSFWFLEGFKAMITNSEICGVRVSMFRVAFSILRDENSADDAVQTAFVRILKFESSPENLESLCVRAAKLAALDILRKKRVRNEVDSDDILTACPTAEKADNLDEVLESVELTERQLVVCRLLASGYRHEDIAEELAVDTRTVRRILVELREVFSK